MAKAAKAAAPKDEVEVFDDVEQRSDAWFELRRGIPTASKFSVVMASGRDGDESVGREKYMEMLAGEIVSGQVAETFRNEAMDRGSRMEPEARFWYERSRLVDLSRIGFVRRTVRVPIGEDFKIGCSPDSGIVGKRKGLEIKSMAPHLLGKVKDRGAGGFPTQFRAQLQGTMWACDWDEMDLVLFYTGWPKPPVFTIGRDESYIQNMREQVEKFCWELRRLIKRWSE